MNKREIQNVANELHKLNQKFSNRIRGAKEGDGIFSFIDDLLSIKDEWFRLLQDLLAAIQCDDSTIPAPHSWNQGGWKRTENCWKHRNADEDARILERTKFWEQHAITMAKADEEAAELENRARRQEIEKLSK
jgi:hypothetical protein